ncbi:zinc ribbon domain-containing protein [Lactobacillus sp. ESL0679]|uniref:zinc ribbon domain-containing protein n=1 Tax=Lactobacillus sp. ESL0679 TaxID=2983209 RepID=UPI0023F93D39|nr:zinc ribbon domain-containing protein [Lactobacillus sp. ESL0679]MDF7683033.1 zinc ribbon domain-containing protein [Lactobacillus sp. ESL0679]
MTTCPNCGKAITDDDQLCPNCHFNLQKYRQTFFTDRHEEVNYEDQKMGKKIASREAYRQEFYPDKQNSTIKKMLEWIRANSMIVFLVGIMLLIIMSFSRGLGWICFFLLFFWLYVVCLRRSKIERYTVDRRLTEKVNQLGSNMFNRVEDHSQKVWSRSKTAPDGTDEVEEETVTVKKHFNYIQLSVVMTALISLIVLFTGSGASVSDITYTGKMSITRVALSLAGQLFGSSSTLLQGVLMCVIWLLLVIFPIIIMYQALQSTKKGKWLAFIFSLVETTFLIYLVFRLSSTTRANTGLFHGLTSQLLMYAVSVGASTYFLILASLMTTVLAGVSLFRKHP